jgi:serine/threonine-protein kinase
MSEETRPERTELPLEVLDQIDRICDRYEAAWRAGGWPRVEDYLGEVAEAYRTALLRDLRAAELHARRRRGERPEPHDEIDRDRVRSDPTKFEPSPAPAPVAAGPAATSVLAGLAETVGELPRILLPDSDPTSDPAVFVRPASPEMPELSGRPARLQLLGEIARGGMGVILKGRDVDLGRDLAVKVLLGSHRDRPDMARRFIEEAQIGGQLQHPGIVPVYELGAFPDRRPYFAMKLVKGRTLAALLAERPDPAHDLPRFLDICEAVCQTVAYAHARGVLHRDLKPSNIMVGSFGEVQVMDWGLAKVLPRGGVADEATLPPAAEETLVRTARSGSDADASRPGSVMGTPAYMAPEQARGETARIDERADVFALGSILCEVLTGRPAYAGGTLADLIRQAAAADLADASARLDACQADAELVALARSCLAPAVEARPRDARAVAGAVSAHRAGVQERLKAAELAEVEARARAAEERKRRKLQLGLAGALLALTAAGGLGGSYWVQQRRDHEARVALVLRDATLLRDQAAAAPDDVAKWVEARRGVEEARRVLGNGVEPAAADQLRALRDEVETGLAAARRDQALLDAAAEVRTSKQDLTPAGADAAYARAFRDADLDIDAAPAAQVGRALRARPRAVAVAAAAALDDWAMVRNIARRAPNDWHRPIQVARVADPDVDRDRLRAALIDMNPTTRQRTLRSMARDPKAAELPPTTAVFLASALRAMKAPEPAVAALRAVVGRHPEDVWANFELAGALRELRPSPRDEAVRYYTAARAIRPETAHELADLLAEMGRGDEAMTVFTDLTTRRPGESRHLYCFGRVLDLRGRGAEARQAFDRAVAAARETIRRQPDDDRAQLTLGNTLRAQKKPAEAIAAFRQVIRLNPNEANAYNNLAAVLIDQKKLAEAIVALRAAIRIEPGVANTHNTLGTTLREKGELAESVAALREAIHLQPDLALAHLNLALTLREQKKPAEAVAAFHDAIRLQPDNGIAHYFLALTLRDQGKLDEAVAAFREAIRLKPDEALFHKDLGVALGYQRKLDEAVAACREAVRIAPANADAYNGLGMALGSQEKLAEAAAAFREAIRLYPDHASAHGNLGIVLQKTGDYAGAVAELRKAHALGARRPGWNEPTAPLLAEAERMAALAARLPAVVSGRDTPRDAAEGLALARMCYQRGHHAAVVRLAAAAFAADPQGADDLEPAHRYNAACSAALVACGRSQDPPPPDEPARAELRARALAWLRADLALWTTMSRDNPAARPQVARLMTHWMGDSDLTGLRDPEALAKLPAEEQKAWRSLWDEVDTLRKTAAQGVRP